MPLRYTNRIPALLSRPDRDALAEREIIELLGVEAALLTDEHTLRPVNMTAVRLKVEGGS